MKKIMLVLIWILILPVTIVMADDFALIFFESIEEMSAANSDIVQLEILDERAEWINSWEGFAGRRPRNWREQWNYDVYTIHRARVLNVFQGELAIGEVIEIRQWGGSLDDTTVTNISAVGFSPGDNVVLFLQITHKNDFVMSAPHQAAYIISDDGELFSYHNHPTHDLELTWDILEQIQYDNETNDNESNQITDGSNIERVVAIIIVVTILAAAIIALIRRSRNKKAE